jgi:DNA polymerase-3 subunit epsilon
MLHSNLAALNAATSLPLPIYGFPKSRGHRTELMEALLRRIGFWERAFHQSIGETRFVVVDTELTGLDKKKDALIALSAVRMAGARIQVGETFYSLVNPGRGLARDNVLVHGLREMDLAHQPTIENALQKFAEFIGEDVIVGHFVEIDLGFLKRDFTSQLKQRLNNRWIDTGRAYQWLHQQEQQFLGGYGMGNRDGAGLNLFDLAKRYRIPIRQAHHALYDAFLAAQLWQRLVVALPDYGVRRLGDAIGIAGG